MEILPGVHSFRLPIPSSTTKSTEMVGETNVYLIQGGDGWLLVDAGWDYPGALRALDRGLKELGLKYEDISRIIVTHFHYDHFGLAGKLKELSGATVAIHRNETTFIDSVTKYADQSLQESREWLYQNGAPEDELPNENYVADIGFPDVLLSGGERIAIGAFDFEVLWTPGHSPGHVCLYEANRKLLFSGDHMLEEITPEIGTSPLHYPSPLTDYLKCLDSMQDLEVDLVLPAHGAPFRHFRERTQELLEHHRNRKEYIYDVLRDGPKKAYDIATKVLWIPQSGGVLWEQLDALNRRLALLETWAHLRLLEEEGKVASFTQGDFTYYCAGRPEIN